MTGSYRADEHGLWLVGRPDRQIAHFSARIVREVRYPDEPGRALTFVIEALRADRAAVTLQVAAADYVSLSWVVERLGAEYVIAAGQHIHVRAAIQELSLPVERQDVFSRMGWHTDVAGSIYVDSLGAIGADGRIDRATVLAEPACRVALGQPLDRTAERELVSALVDSWLTVHPIAGPVLLATMLRAVVGPTEFTVHLYGLTGSYKTAIADVALRMFGADYSADRHANWQSTPTSIELLRSIVRYAVLLIDDYAPQGTVLGDQAQAQVYERTIRHAGNRTGRRRATRDLKLMEPPEFLATQVSTGEDLGGTPSAVSRILAVQVERAEVDLGALTTLQAAATGGELSQMMGGFIRFLAANFDAMPGRLDEYHRESLPALRESLKGLTLHPRTPRDLVDLKFADALLTKYLQSVGAAVPVVTHWRKGFETAILRLAELQAVHQTEADVVELLRSTLLGLLRSERAHLGMNDGTRPMIPEVGWSDDSAVTPRTPKLGYIEGGTVCLYPGPVMGAVASELQRHGRSIGLSGSALSRRLAQQGILAARDAGRGTNTVRRHKQDVWNVWLSWLLSGDLPPNPTSIDGFDG